MNRSVHNRAGLFGFKAALLAALSVIALVSVRESWGQIATQKTLTWLGVVPGYDCSVAYGVSGYLSSHSGPIVVGYVYKLGNNWDEKAFVWSKRLGMRLIDLGSLNASSSWATGVSSNGRVIVGEFSRLLQVGAFAVIDGQPIELPCVGESCGAYDVSADGTVAVGWTLDANGMPRACYWTINLRTRTAEVSLFNSDGFYRSYSLGVAPDKSAAVGMHQFGDCGCSPGGGGGFFVDCYRGVLWRPLSAPFTNLGTVGGRVSTAHAVSQLGRRVVGTSEISCFPEGVYRAFLYCNGNMFVLDSLTSSSQLLNTSEALDISADGTRIVGGGTGLDSGPSAFLWIESTQGTCPPTGRLIDLNLYAFGGYRWNERLTSARSINGPYIVGVGRYRGIQAFLLVYVDSVGHPE